MTELVEHLAAGRLQQNIAEPVPPADAARAHSLTEKGGHTGTFVLTTPATGSIDRDRRQLRRPLSPTRGA